MDDLKNLKIEDDGNTQKAKRIEERKRLFEVVERMANLGILLQAVKRNVH